MEHDPSSVISKVVFRGNQAIPTHHLQRHISTRPGRYFDPGLLQQDVDRLWRLPKVRRVNGPYIEQNADGITVTFEIVERELVKSVQFIGNRGISDRALKKETGLQDGQPLDLHEVRIAKTRIEEYYREKGYPRSQVEIIEGDEVEDGKITFLIHEDTKQKVWDVDFVGNSFATDARLKNFVECKPGIAKVFGGAVNREEIDQDVLRLTTYYRNFGFFNARIGRELVESNDGRWMTIRYIIDEGMRYKVRNVAFIGNRFFNTDQLYAAVALKSEEGPPAFNAGQMNQDLASLRDLYGSQGYVFSQVEAEPRFLEEPGLLDIVYRIDEGRQYYVGSINVHIDGDFGVTKRQVPLNRTSLRPGDLIDIREIRNSERRLTAAGIFAEGGPESTGSAPRIVVRPPELKELERMANGDSSGDSSTRFR
jgi:outer membrane protein insertion porin family